MQMRFLSYYSAMPMSLLIGFWFTPVEVGYFRIARSMADLMSFPVAPLYLAGYPELARLWHQGRKRDLAKLVGRLTTVSTVIGLLGFTAIAIGNEFILNLTVGTEYLPPAPVLLWLALGAAIAVASGCGHPLLFTIGKAGGSAKALAGGVAIQIALLVWLLPQWGVIVAGVSYVVHYVVWISIVIVLTRSVWTQWFIQSPNFNAV